MGRHHEPQAITHAKETCHMATPTVEIHYRVPCGHLPRALGIQKSLLERFGLKIDGVKTGSPWRRPTPRC